jgi:GH25 family lysozyme M1 (1,4-beta-N-acetylmuramidase)
MDYSSRSDYNPTDRQLTDFAKGMPTILDVGIARVTWVLSTQVYTDGIDGSHWNQSTGREMNFHIVKDNGFDFVIWKITESDWFFDETFYPAFEQATDAGLIFLPYHFNRTNKDGFDQAQWMLRKAADYLKVVDGKPILWNDVETDDGGTLSQKQNRARAFNETIVEEGFQTGNYSSKSRWERIMGSVPQSWVNKYFQWVADWTPNSSPRKPIGWERDDFWQYGISPTYSWAKHVGTDGNVDVNRFYGTLQELKEILGITVPPPPDCCEEMKEAIAGIHNVLVMLNDKVSGVDARVGNVENEQLTMARQLEEVKTELHQLSAKVQEMDGNQQEMAGQVEHLLNLVNDVSDIFCKSS